MRRDAGILPPSQARVARGAAALALVVTLGLAPDQGRAEVGCGALGPTRIVVDAVFPNPRVDTSLDLAALKKRARASDAQHDDPSVQLGLFVAQRVGDFEDAIEFAEPEPPTPRQTVCGSPARIRVRFGSEDAVIHIAREAADDPCLADEIKRHEQRHVQVDRETIAAFVPRIEADLRALVARMGAVRGADREAVRHEIRGRIHAVVATDLRALRHELSKRQRFVDRPEEYRRIERACGGAAARLLGGGD